MHPHCSCTLPNRGRVYLGRRCESQSLVHRRNRGCRLDALGKISFRGTISLLSMSFHPLVGTWRKAGLRVLMLIVLTGGCDLLRCSAISIRTRSPAFRHVPTKG